MAKKRTPSRRPTSGNGAGPAPRLDITPALGDGGQAAYAPVEVKPSHDGATRGTIMLIGGAEDKAGDRVILKDVARRAGAGKLVIATVASNPVNSLIGFAILLAGIPACRYWQRTNKPARA